MADVRLAMAGAFETAATAPLESTRAPQLLVWQRPIPLVLAGLVIGGLAVWTLTRLVLSMGARVEP